MTRQRFNEMPPAQQAGIICNDDRFRIFSATRSGMPGTQFTATAAAEYIRNCCGIDSRSALNSNQTAARKFQTLRTEFDAWAGRIHSPR
jgi:hypothetical protein